MASVVRSFSDLSPREVLALALDVERNNAQRIQKLADLHIGRDVAVQRVLLEMRDEELEHERMLEEVWRGRFGDEAKPPIKEIEVREVIEVVDVEAGMEFPLDETDVSDALDLVHRAELAAEAFYRGAAAATDDDELRALFSELADLEAAHINHVEERQQAQYRTKTLP